MLVTITEGEAKLMVKNVLNNEGSLACHHLYRHYNRRTLARAIQQRHRAADCRTRLKMEDEDECEMQPVGGSVDN